MARVNVIFYSMWGHNWKMAEAEAEGVRSAGVDVGIYQIKETLPDDLVKEIGGWETRQEFAHIPVATLDNLKEAHGVIFGTPTRYGNMCAQMRAFLDSTGPLWSGNNLVGRVASVFASSNTQHGGQESTILTFIPTLMHLGYIVAGLPYSEELLFQMDEIAGGGPYGASCVAGQGSEKPVSKIELAIARAQGKYVAEITKKLFG